MVAGADTSSVLNNDVARCFSLFGILLHRFSYGDTKASIAKFKQKLWWIYTLYSGRNQPVLGTARKKKAWLFCQFRLLQIHGKRFLRKTEVNDRNPFLALRS